MSIILPASLQATGGSKTGVGSANLLDVQLVNGDIHYWADRAVKNLSAAITATGAPAIVSYLPWIDSVGDIKIYRSLQTDTCSFVIQNISGDSMQRDFERIARKSALEGAFFVFRIWQMDAAAWFEMHGSLSVTAADEQAVSIKGTSLPLDASNVDGLPTSYSETCQLEWASHKCGATGVTPCQNSFATCQVVERFTGVLNSFEKNYGETLAVTSSYVINRRRKI